MNKAQGNVLLILAIIMGIIVLFFGSILLIIYLNQRERESYQKYISQYLEEPRNNLLKKDLAPKDDVVLKGKLMIVNLNDNSVDAAFSSLPKELKPAGPEEVKTVLWVNCQTGSVIYKYSDGTESHDLDCELRFIDFINKKYLWNDQFYVFPPTVKVGRNRNTDPDPKTKILKYLESIPHQE